MHLPNPCYECRSAMCSHTCFCDSQVDNSSKSLEALRSGVLSVDNVGLPRLGSLSIRSAMARCLNEGSWNAAWDARPARWLHGRHSAWLLFGVCACFSAAAAPLLSAASSPVLTEAVVDNLPPPTAVSEPENEPAEPISATSQTEQCGHGKEIFTDYTVTGKIKSWLSVFLYEFGCDPSDSVLTLEFCFLYFYLFPLLSPNCGAADCDDRDSWRWAVFIPCCGTWLVFAQR
jgi:hypothetical protein